MSEEHRKSKQYVRDQCCKMFNKCAENFRQHYRLYTKDQLFPCRAVKTAQK